MTCEVSVITQWIIKINQLDENYVIFSTNQNAWSLKCGAIWRTHYHNVTYVKDKFVEKSSRQDSVKLVGIVFFLVHLVEINFVKTPFVVKYPENLNVP